MKKLLTLALVCLAYATSFGQNVPQGIAYQAVAVKDGAYSVAGQNPQAIYWSNKDIKVRFTIFDTYPNGSSQYSEVHTTSTDEYGVFNLIIGQGSGLSGDFTTIPWELGDAHLQVEIDFENTNTFTLTALEKFWSVPYAFVTNETGTSSTDSALAALNNKFQYLKDRDKDTVIGNEGISYQALDSLNKALKAEIAALRFSDKDTVIGNELQTLSVTGDSVTISDGNTVVINHPANLDNDPVNEIQTISLSNDTISLSNGGGKVALKNISSNGGGSSNSSSSSNLSNSLCFDGTLIDLSSWANSLGIDYAGMGGKVYDSAFAFQVSTGTNSGVYIIDLSRDSIFKVANYNGQLFNGDSVLYSCGSGSCDVITINQDLSVSTVSFSGGPSTQKNGSGADYGGVRTARVNKSRDLIWLPIQSSGGQADFKKYNYTSNILTTITNPSKGISYSEASDIVNGDTIVMNKYLINSSNMQILNTFSFLEGLSDLQSSYFNGKIYYTSQRYGGSLKSYEIRTGVTETIGNGLRISVGSITNGELLFSVQSGSSTAGNFRFKNARFYGTGGILSITKNNLVKFKGHDGSTTLTNLYPHDNYNIMMGSIYFYNGGNTYITECYNGEYPLFEPGIFYSNE